MKPAAFTASIISFVVFSPHHDHSILRSSSFCAFVIASNVLPRFHPIFISRTNFIPSVSGISFGSITTSGIATPLSSVSVSALSVSAAVSSAAISFFSVVLFSESILVSLFSADTSAALPVTVFSSAGFSAPQPPSSMHPAIHSAANFPNLFNFIIILISKQFVLPGNNLLQVLSSSNLRIRFPCHTVFLYI